MIRLLPRLTLSQRVLAAFCAAVIFSIAIAGYIVVQLREMAALSSEVAHIVAVTEDAYELRIAAVRVMLYVHQYRDSRTTSKLAEIEAARAEAAVKREHLRKHTRLPEVIQSLNRFEALLPQRIAAANVIRADIESGMNNSGEEMGSERISELHFWQINDVLCSVRR